MHNWLVKLAHLVLCGHDLPSDAIFNTIFCGFPKLYWNQIDRWRFLIEDLEEFGLTIEGITRRFLPGSREALENSMAVYGSVGEILDHEFF